MDAKKKALLATVLGLLWVGLAVWEWGALKEPVRVPLTNVTGPASPGQVTKAKSSGLRVNLELLASARTQREETFTAPRNIFAVPSPDGTLPVGNEPVQASEQGPAPEQALLQQAAATELAQYRYLGFLRLGESRKQNKDIAVLSKNEEVVVVKVGDHVEEHLVLKAITPESVTIRDTGARIDQVVPLSEESPTQQ
ncbi:MAG TPA: hypothetical protein VLE03_08280 [Nitrospiraceae bacterium]|nr:hypothetical protein [Nitrospiraceae bacterium]